MELCKKHGTVYLGTVPRTCLREWWWPQLWPLDRPIDIKCVFKYVYLKAVRDNCIRDIVLESAVIKTTRAITPGKTY